MVKRYMLFVADDGLVRHTEDPRGNYVLHSDCAALESLLAEAQTKSNEWRGLYEHGLEDRNELAEVLKKIAPLLDEALVAGQMEHVAEAAKLVGNTGMSFDGVGAWSDPRDCSTPSGEVDG